jgi:hypothetical protein
MDFLRPLPAEIENPIKEPGIGWLIVRAIRAGPEAALAVLLSEPASARWRIPESVIAL